MMESLAATMADELNSVVSASSNAGIVSGCNAFGIRKRVRFPRHVNGSVKPESDMTDITLEEEWLTIVQALRYLKCSFSDLASDIMVRKIKAYSSRGAKILFRRSELNALPSTLEPDEAVQLVRASAADGSTTMSALPDSEGVASEPTLPLKEAALRLNMPYKTLLRLVNEGQVPAMDQNEQRGGRRPRYLVQLSAIQRALANSAELQTARRRAPVVPIDLQALARARRLP